MGAVEENPELEQAFEAPKRGIPLWVKLVVAGVLVVLVIPCVGLLATLVVPRLVQRLGDAQVVKAKVDIVSITNAVQQYAMDNRGIFPSSLADLVAEDSRGIRYLDTDAPPLDPWGRVYSYTPPGPGSNRFRVFTLGADGLPGGEGEDRDIDYDLIQRGGI